MFSRDLLIGGAGECFHLVPLTLNDPVASGAPLLATKLLLASLANKVTQCFVQIFCGLNYVLGVVHPDLRQRRNDAIHILPHKLAFETRLLIRLSTCDLAHGHDVTLSACQKPREPFSPVLSAFAPGGEPAPDEQAAYGYGARNGSSKQRCSALVHRRSVCATWGA
jgi:hypothetical protein